MTAGRSMVILASENVLLSSTSGSKRKLSLVHTGAWESDEVATQ